MGQSQSPLHIPADGLEAVLELLITLVLLTPAGVVAAVMLVTAFGHGRDAYVKLKAKQWGPTSVGWRLLVPGSRNRLVPITTPVVTQSVIAAEQVKSRVQVRVDPVDPVTDGLQSHPPVRRLRLLFAGGHIEETPTGVETQQQGDTGEAAVVHGPRHGRATRQRFRVLV